MYQIHINSVHCVADVLKSLLNLSLNVDDGADRIRYIAGLNNSFSIVHITPHELHKVSRLCLIVGWSFIFSSVLCFPWIIQLICVGKSNL